MFLSPGLSVFYLISVAILFSGLFLFKKSDRPLKSATWFIASMMLFLCINVFAASIINLIHIPINLLTMGIFNCIAGGGLWFLILVKKQRQRYTLELFDWVSVALIAGVAITCGIIQFGTSLTPQYITSDPSVHMKMAMNIINTQSVSEMFFGPLNNALFMSIGMPFVHTLSAVKFFILSEFGMFALHGWVFYILINRFSKNLFTKIFSVVVTVLYMLGYPLNNMIFGYNYLGTGVTVLAFLLFLADAYYKREVHRRIVIPSLMLACLGLFLCYMLFMPFAYVALFLLVAWDYFQQKKLITWEMVRTQLEIFLLPVIIGLIYCFFGWFGSAGAAGNAIAAEGYIYRDLYSNFIIWLPIALYGLIHSLKKKHWTALQPMSILWFCFMIGLLVLGLNTKVSSYYYFKTYYVMWMITLALFYLGITYFSKKSKEMVISYFLVWGFVATMFFSGTDAKVKEHNILFNPEIRSDAQFHIYLFNRYQLQTATPSVTGEEFELYSYLLNHVDQTEQVPIADLEDTTYWYEALTNQRVYDQYFWLTDVKSWCKNIQENFNYVIIMNDCEKIQGQTEFLQSLEIIYSNSAGYLAKTPKGTGSLNAIPAHS